MPKDLKTATAVSAPSDPAHLPEDVSIVYFGNDWFAENRTSSHHIARRLGRRYPMLYVETPGMRAPQASSRDLKKIWNKLKRAAQPPQLVRDQISVLTMPQIPFRRVPFVRQLNQLYGRWAVRRAMRRLGFRKVISWFAVPHPGALAGRLGEDFVVYYCIDDYAGLPDVDRTQIAALDDQLTRTADQVFVASATLIERKKQLNPATAHSPHGVDFDHFQRASDPATPVAERTRNLPHPVIGFFGVVSGWIDIDLLVYLAKSRPQWTFLFVGMVNVNINVSELSQCPNVVFAGAQPYEKLPEWAKAFDVAILPYAMNRGSINANPLKLREYLATGKPVVAVSTPEVERFSHCVRIAHNSAEFLEKIEDALTRDTAEQKLARTREVMTTTWDARVATALSVVQTAMLRKITSR